MISASYPPPNHTKHLNTPRLVADAAGTTVWRWDQAEPFGDIPVDQDPDANSVAFDLPLRIPDNASTGIMRPVDRAREIYAQPRTVTDLRDCYFYHPS